MRHAYQFPSPLLRRCFTIKIIFILNYQSSISTEEQSRYVNSDISLHYDLSLLPGIDAIIKIVAQAVVDVAGVRTQRRSTRIDVYLSVVIVCHPQMAYILDILVKLSLFKGEFHLSSKPQNDVF